MNNSKQISILGCGWLGLPLAKHLASKGHRIKGSVRKKESLCELAQSPAQTYILDVGTKRITGNLPGFLKNAEILIISIPPRLRKQSSENFVDRIKIIVPHIEQSGIKKVVFISSTSVYTNDNSTVTEETLPMPETESGKQLLASENILKMNSHFQTTVIRFGGLIGPNRHPVTSLAGKKNLEDPEAPVNLIHLDDCIQIISSIIAQDKWAEIFNAVASFHPMKERYYREAARKKGLSEPCFNRAFPSKGKIVCSRKIQHVLNYKFIKSDLNLL